MNPLQSFKLIKGVFFIAFFLWGCGGGGSTGGGGGNTTLTVSGTVQAPNGQVAFSPQQDLLERFASLFLSSADASISGISPVANGTQVELVRVDNTGNIITILASTTVSGGNYSFDLTALGLSFSSDLMVQVVNTSTGAKMRAFVVSETANIDPVSEAVVRTILHQIAMTPGIALSNFTIQELSDLEGSMEVLTISNQSTAGPILETTVAAIENLATDNTDIMTFIASATGNSQTPEGPGDVGNYFPFTLGNTWRFQRTISENGGSPISFSHTEMITGTKVINGVITMISTETSEDNSGNITVEDNFLVKDSRGINNWGNNNPNTVIPLVLIPYKLVIFPLQVNSTFQQLNKRGVNFGDLNGDGRNEIGNIASTVTVAAFENVTVPAGFFQNCVKIETTTTTAIKLSSSPVTITMTGTDTTWYAPGVGPVKEMNVIQSQGGGQTFSQTVTEELSSFILNAPVTEKWVSRYNGMSSSVISIDTNGNVYVTGGIPGASGFLDYGTVKYDSNGNQLWAAIYNTPRDGNDVSAAIAVDASGNVYVTGFVEDGLPTGRNYATIKYDANGNQLWVARYAGPNGDDEATALAVDANGDVYVTGVSGGIFYDYATIKYDTNGNQLWVARYNGPSNLYDSASAITVDANGNVYVTGESEGPGTGVYAAFDYATIKYDTNGNQLWVARYNGPGNDLDSATALVVDANGNVYVTGTSNGLGAGMFNAFDYATVKYDSNGNQLWAARYHGPGTGNDYAHALAVDTDGNAYVTGESTGADNNSDYATIKYDANGNQLWVERYNGLGNGNDSASDVAVDAEGNVYVTGRATGAANNFDYVTIKYDANGSRLWTVSYIGLGNGDDSADALTVDTNGNVYVTGQSGTIKYEQPH